MEDITAIRRQNLDVLVAEAGSLKAIAQAMAEKLHDVEGDEIPNYANTLSQLKGKKSMGSKIARKLEIAMGKSRGWMDALHGADHALEGKEASQIAMSIADPDERQTWLNMGRIIADRTAAQPSAANPFPQLPKGGKKKKGTK